MKQLILGDIHGRTIWKKIVEKESDADRIIFIGDYLDTHYDITGLEQLNNLEQIFKFKRESDKHVIMLIGNHDYHYFPGIDNQCSGYQPGMRASFEYCLNENKKLLQMCFADEYGTIYSHAGLTDSFINRKVGSFSEKNVNDTWKYKPQSFDFYMGDRSGNGNDINQSCIWVRPDALLRDKINGLMVVGHTSVKDISHVHDDGKPILYMIDALENGKYLTCVDGVFDGQSIDI